MSVCRCRARPVGVTTAEAKPFRIASVWIKRSKGNLRRGSLSFGLRSRFALMKRSLLDDFQLTKTRCVLYLRWAYETHFSMKIFRGNIWAGLICVPFCLCARNPVTRRRLRASLIASSKNPRKCSIPKRISFQVGLPCTNIKESEWISQLR